MSIPKSTMNYHLNYLKKRGYLVSRPSSRYHRYYITNGISEDDKKIFHLIRQEIPYKIVIFLLQNPGASQKKISNYLKKHPTTISYHMNKLIDVNIVEFIPNGNEIKYTIKNKENLSNWFDKYKESFLDNIIEDVM